MKDLICVCLIIILSRSVSECFNCSINRYPSELEMRNLKLLIKNNYSQQLGVNLSIITVQDESRHSFKNVIEQVKNAKRPFKAFRKIHHEVHRYHDIAFKMMEIKLPEHNETRSEVYKKISTFLTLIMKEIEEDAMKIVKNPEKLLKKLKAERTKNYSKIVPPINDYTRRRGFDEVYLRSLKKFLREALKKIGQFRRRCS